jgi:hypothetical protein
MKLTINKLIANDIINYGMDQTSGFDYSVGLDEYLEQYDEDSQKYILENISEICSDISANERVADFIFEEETKDFNMVFYWGYLLNDVEKIVFNKSQKLNDEMDFEDIRNIANDFVDSDTFNKDLESKINNYSRGVELA